MKSKSDKSLPRRHFLQQLLMLGGATGAASLMVAGGRQSLTAGKPAQAKTDTASQTTSKGYRLTSHIRTYYEKAGF